MQVLPDVDDVITGRFFQRVSDEVHAVCAEQQLGTTVFPLYVEKVEMVPLTNLREQSVNGIEAIRIVGDVYEDNGISGFNKIHM